MGRPSWIGCLTSLASRSCAHSPSRFRFREEASRRRFFAFCLSVFFSLLFFCATSLFLSPYFYTLRSHHVPVSSLPSLPFFEDTALAFALSHTMILFFICFLLVATSFPSTRDQGETSSRWYKRRNETQTGRQGLKNKRGRAREAKGEDHTGGGEGRRRTRPASMGWIGEDAYS